MAPLLATLIPRDSRFNPATTSNEFRDQYIHPGDIFSVLLILGGDVVARALAQLADGGLTPFTFSFGWVAYSVSALVSAVGENKLMPQSPDCQCKVINGKNGQIRNNSSWVLGRIVRDFEIWSDLATKQKTRELLTTKWIEMKARDTDAEEPTRAGLVVTIYKPSDTSRAGVAKRDMVYWSGLLVLVVQLGIAAIPCGLFGDWGILLITVCGNALAIATGLLPQWKKEKWACRTKSKETYVLTRGNGAQHAIVILGNKHGLNLEDLASGQSNIDASTNNLTRIILLILSTLWVLFLIAASGLKTNTWFLLGIGAIGIVQNVFVAGWNRRPENFGIPLDFIDVFGQTKVMETLQDVEKSYQYLGQSMLQEFFSRKLRPDEEEEWEQINKSHEARRLRAQQQQAQYPQA
ncbi:uncharacterized protein N7487_007237 [Penicillium crustosum]|uniref:uncharacterized protein n=1 Tax=Penicillium crustosum TaxID=36656 RepID=UPI0023A502E6|nr:uncharacterized protein N7487_007237 [Penicillium crustosum]KAJ5401341.1 hypothetical protein N7487_007237 [Penicillium crustosum]